MSRHIMRGLLVLLFGLTGLPVVSLAGLFFLPIAFVYGFTLAYQGQPLRGVFTALVSALALFGLVTIWSLAKQYWSNPFCRPSSQSLRRHVTGIASGVVSLLALWTPTAGPADTGAAAAAMGGLFTVPATLFVSGRLWWSMQRTANQTLTTDVPKDGAPVS